MDTDTFISLFNSLTIRQRKILILEFQKLLNVGAAIDDKKENSPDHKGQG